MHLHHVMMAVLAEPWAAQGRVCTHDSHNDRPSSATCTLVRSCFKRTAIIPYIADTLHVPHQQNLLVALHLLLLPATCRSYFT
jgi:hypothetical protein